VFQVLAESLANVIMGNWSYGGSQVKDSACKFSKKDASENQCPKPFV
jgi:hypothetical protein